VDGEVILINNYITSIIKGSLYGFFCGMFIWVFSFLVYQIFSIEGSQVNSQISINPIGFPVKFLPLCLFFMFFSSCIRLLMKVFYYYKDTFVSWVITGIFSFATICLIMLGEEFYFSGKINNGLFWFLNKPNNFLICFFIFALIALYTLLFMKIKDVIASERGINDFDRS
jgi:hypothetical protein